MKQLLKLLKEASPSHPRLFLPACEEDTLRAKINANTLLGKVSEQVIAIANGMIPLPPMERVVEGRRLLRVSRIVLRRLNHLGLAYRLTGDSRYARRAEQEMLAVAAFDDWNPSHFLDVAEMTIGVAVGYDWCYGTLSAESRTVIRAAIIEKGLQASLVGEHRWVAGTTNWNQVCHAGMVIGALTVYEDAPELAEQMIERALANIHHAMEAYQPDGNFPEGPMYWSYGTSFNVLLIDALQSVLGEDFGLPQSPGFLQSARYVQQATSPAGLFFNYCDCVERAGVLPEMFWFASKTEDPSLLWKQREKLEKFVTEEHSPEGDEARLYPLLLIWARSLANIAEPTDLSWKGDGKTPVGMHRSSWTDPKGNYVAIKGGTPRVSHGHMDIGTFVMESNGVRWAIDLGTENYHNLESRGLQIWGPDRWKIFRLNSHSHNVLTVDGQLQELPGLATICRFSAEGPTPHTIVDTTATYAGQLTSARRGVGLHNDGRVVIQDEIKALDKETSVRWAMATRADVSFDSEQKAVLQQEGQQLILQVLSPANAKLEIYELNPPPTDYDTPNPGAKMVGFTVVLPAGAEETLTILLTPGDVSQASPAITFLRNW